MTNPLQWIGIKLVRFYQLAISPWTPASCKYYPTCSAYAIEAIKVQGFFKGVGLGAWRILRCNPWSRGGVDFPPGSTLEVPIPPDPIDDDDASAGPTPPPSQQGHVPSGRSHSHPPTSGGPPPTSTGEQR